LDVKKNKRIGFPGMRGAQEGVTVSEPVDWRVFAAQHRAFMNCVLQQVQLRRDIIADGDIHMVSSLGVAALFDFIHPF